MKSIKNVKKCPIGLDGYQHCCPEEPGKHAPLSKIRSFLETKFRGKLSSEIEPHNAGHWETLQFIRNGCQKTDADASLQETKKNEYLEELKKAALRTPVAELAEKPAVITAEQKAAMEEIKRLRSERSQASGEPGLESSDEAILDAWRDNPGVRAEFTCYESYKAYTMAAAQGRAKIVGGRTIK